MGMPPTGGQPHVTLETPRRFPTTKRSTIVIRIILNYIVCVYIHMLWRFDVIFRNLFEAISLLMY